MSRSDKIGYIVLGMILLAITILLSVGLSKRYYHLSNYSQEGVIKVLDARLGRKGKTTRATYLDIKVYQADTVFLDRSKRSAGLIEYVEVGKCYSMIYSTEDPSIMDIDYEKVVVCPE